MSILTNEQIEQKMQQLQQLTEAYKALSKELIEAGALEIPEGELEDASGGRGIAELQRDLAVQKKVQESSSGNIQALREPFRKMPF